jgi:hypothetical protein
LAHAWFPFFAMMRRGKYLVVRSGCVDSHQCRFPATKDTREAFS